MLHGWRMGLASSSVHREQSQFWFSLVCGRLGHGRWTKLPTLASYQFKNGLMVGKEISFLKCLVYWLLGSSRPACGPWPIVPGWIHTHSSPFPQQSDPCSGKGPSLYSLTLPREVGVVLAPALSLDPGPNEVAHFCFLFFSSCLCGFLFVFYCFGLI